MRIALVPHINRERSMALARDLVAEARDHGVDVLASSDAAADIGVAPTRFDTDSDLDLVVAIGGDGTVLKAVRIGRGSGAPIFGINAGRLGFLAEGAPHDLRRILEQLISGKWYTSERMLLAASVEGAAPVLGLNDVVIEKVENQRIIQLAVSIDDEPFTTYRADGVVVATATGSTAYSLSAGGPLVDPALDALVITPVAPHSLFSRSVVFPPGRRLRFEVGEDRSVGVGVDGLEIATVQPGGAVVVESAGRVAFASLTDRSFPTTVKQKFSLE